MDSFTGKTVRGYELRDLVGQGGFGAVYRAYQPAVAREVAIKVILPQYANQPQFIRGFETEAQLVARLEHPYIVPLFDYWQDETGAYIVMRFLRGGSLRRMLNTQEKLPPTTVARLLEQIGGALTTAHRGGVVHRDLKPDNILLDEEGNGYLTDFGIAKPVGHENTNEQVSGSLAYMSPEQLMGLPPTPVADIYSLGIIIYELLAGDHPFGSMVPPSQLIMKHLHENVPDFSDLPHAYSDFIQKVTAKNPDDRFQDALTVALEFRHLVYPDSAATRSDLQDLLVNIKQPDGEPGTIIQEQIDKLYRELSDLYERVNATQRLTKQNQVQSEIEQVRKEIEFRAASLDVVDKYAAPEMPLRLRPPTTLSHELVGVESEFSDIRIALMQNKSVTILGPSGVGKSELAAAIAMDPEVQQHFEWRVVWFPLGKNADVFSLMGEWLMALGVTEDKLTALTKLEQRKQRLLELAGSRPTLVVVDDLWQLSDLTGALMDKRTSFVYVVTTRLAETAADLLWKVVRLDALNTENRLKLLQQLVPEITPDDDVQNLLTRVGGLPRDLILVGTRLRRAGSTASRLKREVEKLLKSPLEVFEQGYEALGLSVESLSDEARKAFRTLAILPPEPNIISEDAADAICGDLAYVDELVDVSLVRADDGYYAVHPSFVDYARKHLPEDRDDFERIIDYFLEYARKNIKDYNALGREHRNLEASLKLAAENGIGEPLVEGALLLSDFWRTRGMIEVLRQNILQALERGTAKPVEQAELHLRLAILLLESGDHQAADDNIQQGLDELAKLNAKDPQVLKVKAALVGTRGRLRYAQRQIEEARSLLTEALEASEAVRDHAQVSSHYNNLGSMAIMALHDPVMSKDYFLKGLEYGRKANHGPSISLALQNLGLLEDMYFNNYAQAKKYLAESFDYAHRLGHFERMSGILQNRGLLELRQNNLNQARAHFEESLQKARVMRNTQEIGYSLMQLANLLVSLSEFEKGEQSLKEAVEAGEKLNDAYMVASIMDVLAKLGETRIVEQQLDFDVEVYTSVLNVARMMNFEARRLDRLLDLVGRLREEPETPVQKAAAIAQAQLNIGLIEGREFNDFPLARKHFAESIKQAKESGKQTLLMDALLEDAYAAVQVEAFAEAETLLAEAMTCAPDDEFKKKVADTLLLNLEGRKSKKEAPDSSTIEAITKGLGAEQISAIQDKIKAI